MKRKLLSVILTSAMVAALLTGCGGGSSTPDAAADAGSETTDNAAEESNESADDAAVEEAAVPAGDGSVYLLNFKPESDQQWKDLAAIYTEQTGVEVNVLTAAEGTYSTTMQAEMAKDEAPTIFNIGNVTAAQTWNDYTYDLSGTALYDHLSDKSLVIKIENEK